MSSAASSSSSSSAASSRVQELLEEHAVALASIDAHAAVQIALHLHTLQRTGIKCVALDDQQTDAVKALPSIPPHWSASADGFCFQYLSSDGARFVIKSIRMDRALLVHGAKKADKADVQSMEVNVDEFVNAAAIPAAAPAASGAAAEINFAALFRNLPALLTQYDNAVLNALLPKPAAASSSDSSSKIGVSSQPQPRPDFDPLRVPPRNPPQPRNPLIDDDPSNNPYLRDPFQRPRVGDFAGDLDPLFSGGPNAGNLLGPRNFPGVGGQQPGMPGMPRVPGMAPRFDPYGPAPGMGEPDFDELPPPGLGGPGFGPGRMGGQPRRGGGGGGFGGMDPRGGGPGGFPGGGFH